MYVQNLFVWEIPCFKTLYTKHCFISRCSFYPKSHWNSLRNITMGEKKTPEVGHIGFHCEIHSLIQEYGHSALKQVPLLSWIESCKFWMLTAAGAVSDFVKGIIHLELCFPINDHEKGILVIIEGTHNICMLSNQWKTYFSH